MGTCGGHEIGGVAGAGRGVCAKMSLCRDVWSVQHFVRVLATTHESIAKRVASCSAVRRRTEIVKCW